MYNSPTSIPIGSVNRNIFAGETSLNTDMNKWYGFAGIIKLEESPIIIKSEIVNFDSATKRVKLSVKVIFTKQYDVLVNLSIFLTEDKIISKQSMPYALPNDIKDDYEHNHVLRKTITPYNGIPLKINRSIIGNYEIGRTFEKEFEVELSSKWEKENCALVILVNRDDTSKEVLQASQLDLQ